MSVRKLDEKDLWVWDITLRNFYSLHPPCPWRTIHEAALLLLAIETEYIHGHTALSSTL